MKLSIYNKSNFNSAFEAQTDDSIDFIAEISIPSTISVEDLNEKSDYLVQWKGTMNLIEKTIQATSYSEFGFVLVGDGELLFEYIGEKWVSFKLLNEIEKQCKEDKEFLDQFSIRISPISGNEVNVYFISKTGSVTVKNVSLCSDDDVELDGNTFDFTVTLDQVNDCYEISLFNVIDLDGNGTVRKNEDFEYSLEYYPSYYETVSIFIKIHEQLEKIEEWKSDAYCGPLVNGTGVEGDDIYQALHEIRKLIEIGEEAYEKEINEAKLKESDGL